MQAAAPDVDLVVDGEDAEVDGRAGLGVLVVVGGLDPRGPVVEVEADDAVLLALVEVDGAGVDHLEGAALNYATSRQAETTNKKGSGSHPPEPPTTPRRASKQTVTDDIQ